MSVIQIHVQLLPGNMSEMFSHFIIFEELVPAAMTRYNTKDYCNKIYQVLKTISNINLAKTTTKKRLGVF